MIHHHFLSLIKLKIILFLISIFCVAILYLVIRNPIYSILKDFMPAIGGVLGACLSFILAYFLFEKQEENKNLVKLKNDKKIVIPALISELEILLRQYNRIGNKLERYLQILSKNRIDEEYEYLKILELKAYLNQFPLYYNLDRFIFFKKCYEEPNVLNEGEWKEILSIYHMMNELSLEISHWLNEYFEFDLNDEVDREDYYTSIIDTANSVKNLNKRLIKAIEELIKSLKNILV